MIRVVLLTILKMLCRYVYVQNYYYVSSLQTHKFTREYSIFTRTPSYKYTLASILRGVSFALKESRALNVSTKNLKVIFRLKCHVDVKQLFSDYVRLFKYLLLVGM